MNFELKNAYGLLNELVIVAIALFFPFAMLMGVLGA